MPADWKDWARKERAWTDPEIEQEASNFSDYWQAKATNAAKLDWRKAWQTWVRGSRRPDGSRPSGTKLTAADQRASQLRTAAFYDRIGRSSEAAVIRQELAIKESGQAGTDEIDDDRP
jgi:hypothetical protein